MQERQAFVPALVVPAPQQGAAGVLAGIVERLETVLDQETACLRENRPEGLADFNARKSHGLLELMRGMRGVDAAALDPRLAARLRSLRAKLEQNQAVLKRHMDAVQEVSALISGAMRDAESDGTYSAAIRFGRQ